jgi:hypothetical protein
MPDENKPQREGGRKRIHHAIVAAVIVALGGVLAALVGLFNSGSKNVANGSGNAQGNSGTVVQGNSGTTIVGSSHVTIGRQESAFDAANGVAIENLAGDYTVGNGPPKWNRYLKPSGVMYAMINNRSHRKISSLSLTIFPEGGAMTGTPLLEVRADKLFPRQNANAILRTAGDAPPQRIRLCLSWESETPGQFITLLVSADRGAPVLTPTESFYVHVPFRYQLETPDAVFRSASKGNCTQQHPIDKVDISDSHIYR